MPELSSVKVCSLCDPGLGPVLATSFHWQLVLNRNQNLLGKCFWVLRRHLESVSGLTAAEWADLHPQLTRTTRALTSAFRPDHFNYSFLQNKDRHVHLHIIPRYRRPRVFMDLTFEDPDYPAHYAVPALIRRLDSGRYAALAQQLREAL